jgi:hypothetical protein
MIKTSQNRQLQRMYQTMIVDNADLNICFKDKFYFINAILNSCIKPL